MGELSQLAQAVQMNVKSEAQAVLDYTALLQQIDSLPIEDGEKTQMADTIVEIISDELNHNQRLQELYTKITGIVANKE